jgi:hypothetical protein
LKNLNVPNESLSFPLLLLLFAVLVLFAFLNLPFEVISGSNVIIRPSSKALAGKITSGPSLLSFPTRARVATMIVQMDEAHKYRLNGSGITFDERVNIDEWIYERTTGKPRMIYLPERAILAALSLQVDMLDKLLLLKTSSEADRLRCSRMNRRILNNNQRIFGDYRDCYVAELLETLSHIGALQNALWTNGENRFEFPSYLIGGGDVEEYLLSKIQIVARNAAACNF